MVSSVVYLIVPKRGGVSLGHSSARRQPRRRRAVAGGERRRVALAAARWHWHVAAVAAWAGLRRNADHAPFARATAWLCTACTMHILYANRAAHTLARVRASSSTV